MVHNTPTHTSSINSALVHWYGISDLIVVSTITLTIMQLYIVLDILNLIAILKITIVFLIAMSSYIYSSKHVYIIMN